jgi:hypothetical protein
MSDNRPQTLVGIEISVHPTGSVVADFRYAASLEDHQAGRIKLLQLAMTARQAGEVADGLQAAAAASRQSREPGHAAMSDDSVPASPPTEQAPYADNAVVARLLRTGMDDRKLRAIGVITLIWNSIEFDFQELVWVIANWSPWDGSLVTADMGNMSRIQLALNMLHRKIKDDRLKTEASVIIDYFDACRVMRNRLVHGVPVYDDNGKISGRIAHFEARRGTGEISIKHIEVTQAYLVLLLADLLICAEHRGYCSKNPQPTSV